MITLLLKEIANHILTSECNMDFEVSTLIAQLVWNKLKSRVYKGLYQNRSNCNNKEDVYTIVKTLIR